MKNNRLSMSFETTLEEVAQLSGHRVSDWQQPAEDSEYERNVDRVERSINRFC